MVNKNQGTGYHKGSTLGVSAGLLIGCLAGAILMILLARQSGMKTCNQIWQRSIKLHDRVAGTINDLVTLTHYDNRQIPARLRVQTNFKTPKPV